jgi:hypothetical protein
MELSTTREACICEDTRYFPSFYALWRFITEFSRPIQSTSPHPISPRPILILSIHLRLGLPNGLFPSGFRTNNLYAFLFYTIHATCPVHFILLNMIILIILAEESKSRSSSLCTMHKTLHNQTRECSHCRRCKLVAKTNSHALTMNDTSQKVSADL